MSYTYGKFVWFEHVSTNVDACKKFYTELFGWNFASFPMGDQTYYMIQSGGEGIGGYRAATPGVPSHWMSYLSVPDVDAGAVAAKKAGAAVLMGPMDFGPVGRGAALKDPQGAPFSIWHNAQNDRTDVKPIAIGDWYWNELMTSDAEAALKFYAGTFGFEHDSMDMGSMGKYYMLKKDGVSRAGLMKSPEPKAPISWTPYIRVADCDVSANKAKQLGAQIAVPPTDIPGVGRFAILADPTGAMVGIIRGDN